MRVLITNTYVFDSERELFRRGTLLIGGDRILRIGGESYAEMVYDAGGALALPGFVDIHKQGRAGCDFVSASVDEQKKMSESYLSLGTTTLMPTLASAPFDDLLAACDRINKAKNDSCRNFAGIHLEGRYLNPKKRGAHSEALLAPLDADELERLVFRMCTPCRATAALELDDNGAFAARARSLGVTLSLGHTCANYAQAVSYFTSYGVGFSHTWNAMPSLHHRDGGAVGAALDSDAYCELICDGMHIAPEIVRLTYKCKGNRRLALITDSMEATGCPDGEYSIAGQACFVRDGRALTADGVLAGSTLDMKTALENLMSFCRLPLSRALRCATLTPAEAAGLSGDVGSLEAGKRADILLCRTDSGRLELEKIICGGIPHATEG